MRPRREKGEGKRGKHATARGSHPQDDGKVGNGGGGLTVTNPSAELRRCRGGKWTAAAISRVSGRFLWRRGRRRRCGGFYLLRSMRGSSRRRRQARPWRRRCGACAGRDGEQREQERVDREQRGPVGLIFFAGGRQGGGPPARAAPRRRATWCGSAARSLQGRRRRILRKPPAPFSFITDWSFSDLNLEPFKPAAL